MLGDRPAPDEPPPEDRGAATRSELLHFVYTCPQAIVMTSAEGRVRLMSAGAAALLLPLSDDGAIDDVFALLDPHAPRFREVLREAVTGPARRLTGLRIPIAARGRRPATWLEVSAVAFDQGYSLACSDATAAVEREARYLAAVADEAHQRGKSETAGAILHDLGNVLTGIGGRAVEVQRQISDTSVARNLTRARAFLEPHTAPLDALLGAGKGKALVDLLGSMAGAVERAHGDALASLEKMSAYLTHAQELLAIQRTYAGPGNDASQGRVGVERLLLDVCSMEQSMVEKRGGAMDITPLAARLPPVRVDRSKLMQVLLNLVRNAAESFDELPAGSSPRVVLSAALEPGGGLAIEVRDTGPGFAAEVGAHLFERGFSTKQRGSGVGLSSCRAVVESFGGALTLTSDGPGAGALARIVLPREVVANEPG